MTKISAVNKKQSVEEAFGHILRADIDLVKCWEPIAFKGNDIEGVHQMRVGLRRMRSALTVFRSAMPRKQTKPLSSEMRWAAHELDHARDIDVYIDENFPQNGAKWRRGEKKMLKVALQDRKQTHDGVKEFIKGKRFGALKKDLDLWLDSKGWRDKLTQKERKLLKHDIKTFAAEVLEQHRSRVLKDGQDIRILDSEALHQLRIDCKKLRYATEFFDPLYGRSMAKFTRHLKGLQDLLGTLHDTAVFTGLQKQLLKGHGSSQVKRFAVNLEGRRSKQAIRQIKTLEKRWQVFAQAKLPWRTALA
ncbi:MAG: CHAD domain-containing protein [Pseudomonadota bacterium]